MPNPVFTVADGLIWLRQSVQRNSMVRKMEIMKMRGQPTLAGAAHVSHRRRRPRGVRARRAAAPRRSGAAQAAADARLRIGVPRLDEMLGGGLPRGYSLLVAGPSGSGKSILAAAFLAEGARCGETGVIAAFEQHPDRSRDRVHRRAHRRAARVGLVDSRAPDLSIDEIVLLLMSEIRRLKATPRRDRFAVGLRARAGADVPRGLSRVAGCAWSRRWPAPASRC